MTAASRAAVRARLVAEAERQLSPSEVAAYLDAPVSREERADARALVAWFRARYSTGAERLAYARRAYRRWMGDPQLSRAVAAPLAQEIVAATAAPRSSGLGPSCQLPGAVSHVYARLVTCVSNQSSSAFTLNSSCRSSPQPCGSRGAM